VKTCALCMVMVTLRTCCYEPHRLTKPYSLWHVASAKPRLDLIHNRLDEIKKVHCSTNQIYVFPEMKLRALVPKSFIHVSVSNFYIPRIGLPMWLQQNKNRQTDHMNIFITQRYINADLGRKNIIFLFWKLRGCTVSFLGIHKSEPDIYTRFSPALHLQGTVMTEWYIVY
jgi:hypothetical protein